MGKTDLPVREKMKTRIRINSVVACEPCAREKIKNNGVH